MFDEYGNPIGVGDPNAEFDPSAYSVDEIPGPSFAAAIEQAGELGAQRALAAAQQQQQQQAMQQTQIEAFKTFNAAEEAIAASDPTWPQKSELAWRTLGEHPTFANAPDVVVDPVKAADALLDAYAYGNAKAQERAVEAKAADDKVAIDRIQAAAGLNWSGYMARGGRSVHDILNENQ